MSADGTSDLDACRIDPAAGYAVTVRCDVTAGTAEIRASARLRVTIA